MAKIRMFTEEVYNALKKGVCDDGFWAGVGDWFSDGWQHICDIFVDTELDSDMDNLEGYFKYVADINDYTDDKIDEIFIDVKKVDESYAKIVVSNNEVLNGYRDVLDNLLVAISKPDFDKNFEPSQVIEGMANEIVMMAGTRWEDILEKDPSEISDEEYLAIALYAVTSGDEQVFEDILNACYEEDVDGLKIFENGNIYYKSTTVVRRYKADERIDKLAAALYEIQSQYLNDVEKGDTPIDEDMIDNAVQLFEIANILKDNKELCCVFGQESSDANGAKGKITEFSLPVDLSRDHKTRKWKMECIPDSDSLANCQKYEAIIGYKDEYTINPLCKGSESIQKLNESAYQYLGVANIEPSEVARDTLIVGVAKLLTGYVIKGYCEADAIVISPIQSAIQSNMECDDNNKAMSIANLSSVITDFDLLIATIDKNDNVKDYTFTLFPTDNTKYIIDAFNQYMQNEDNKEVAKEIQYDDLPGGKLTYNYVATHPDELVKLLERLQEYNGPKDESSTGYKTIMDDIKDLAHKNRDKEN